MKSFVITQPCAPRTDRHVVQVLHSHDCMRHASVHADGEVHLDRECVIQTQTVRSAHVDAHPNAFKTQRKSFRPGFKADVGQRIVVQTIDEGPKQR